MAGLVAPKAMVKVGPPLLAKAAKRGSAELAMVPLKLVAVRIRLLTPLVVVLPELIVETTKSVTEVVLWPMIVLLINAVAVAPSPKT